MLSYILPKEVNNMLYHTKHSGKIIDKFDILEYGNPEYGVHAYYELVDFGDGSEYEWRNQRYSKKNGKYILVKCRFSVVVRAFCKNSENHGQNNFPLCTNNLRDAEKHFKYLRQVKQSPDTNPPEHRSGGWDWGDILRPSGKIFNHMWY